MFLVTIQPKPIQVLVDTLNADLAEELARQHLQNIINQGVTNFWLSHPVKYNGLITTVENAKKLTNIFFADKSDAKVERSNAPSFGAIYKVI